MMRANGRHLMVLLLLGGFCTVARCNTVTGFGYEMISNRLNSLQALESDLVTYTNDTARQLSRMVDLLTKYQPSGAGSGSASAGQPPTANQPLVPSGASCRDVPSRKSGIYRIDPEFPFREPMTVFCEQQYEGGGWTVIQRRSDGSVDFFRDWQEYRRGFGSLHGEFWLGLEQIYRLTNAARHELLVLLEDFDGAKAVARYDRFRIAGEPLSYALMELGTCVSCSAGDAMRIHLNESFSTYDHDKSKATFNCAAVFRGGWWFYKCHRSHLNGVYLRGKLTDAQDSQGLMWMDFRGDKYSLKATKMMIRPFK